MTLRFDFSQLVVALELVVKVLGTVKYFLGRRRGFRRSSLTTTASHLSFHAGHTTCWAKTRLRFTCSVPCIQKRTQTCLTRFFLPRGQFFTRYSRFLFTIFASKGVFALSFRFRYRLSHCLLSLKVKPLERVSLSQTRCRLVNLHRLRVACHQIVPPHRRPQNHPVN